MQVIIIMFWISRVGSFLSISFCACLFCYSIKSLIHPRIHHTLLLLVLFCSAATRKMLIFPSTFVITCTLVTSNIFLTLKLLRISLVLTFLNSNILLSNFCTHKLFHLPLCVTTSKPLPDASAYRHLISRLII